MRAIACLMVILHHLTKRLQDGSQILPINELQFLTKTFASGVCVFFVLSGFLLSYPFWSAYLEGRPFPNFRVYVIRRAARIMPGYYLSLTTCFILSLLFISDVVNPVFRYVSGVFFINAFSWRTFFPADLNGPLWSIGFEVICYFLLPFAMVGLFHIGKTRKFLKAVLYWIVVLAVVLFINGLIQRFGQTDTIAKSWDFGLIGGAKVWWPNYNPIGFFGQYIFGVLAAGFTIMLSKVLKKQRESCRFLRFDLAVLAVCGLMVYLLWSMRHEGPFAFSFQNQPYYYPLFPLLTATLLCILPFTKAAAGIFDNRFFKFTAKLSFGLYIWHNVILELIRLTWIPEYYHTGMTDLTSWFVISALAILLSYLMAFLSWNLVENPVLKWAHGKCEKFKVPHLNHGLPGKVIQATLFTEKAPAYKSE